MFGSVKYFLKKCYFSERKIFSSVLLHYKNCFRKYFHVFGSILKILFFYKFFTFSQHPNKFYYRKFQNHSQIPIHRTNHSQIPTPHTTETPIQPTVANSGNQKPQPPKHHYHTTTITTKIKITQKSKSQRERDRWIENRWVEGSGSKARSCGGEIEGEIEQRGAIGMVLRSTRSVRSGACDRRTGARGSPATSKA